MSDTSSRRNTVSSDPTAQQRVASDQIDRFCDAFARSWKSDRVPISIESMLRRAPRSLRSPLFRELLEIEIEIRTSRNEDLDVSEYLERFPQEAELTDLIFRKTVRRRKLGDYELLDEIGHGGMGVVYRARQVFLNQQVAIKILSQHYHSDAHVVSRFRREMRMIGGLHHPNIVQALNAGESGDTLYLVMEYVDGFSIQQLVRNGENTSGSNLGQNSKQGSNSETKITDFPNASTPRPLKSPLKSDYTELELDITSDYPGPVYNATESSIPNDSTGNSTGKSEGVSFEKPAEELITTQLSVKEPEYPVSPTVLATHFPWGAAAEIVRQTAFGLSHAFEQGLVHRDIKPANIMVTKKGVVKILDLGLGKFRAENRLSESREAAITQFGATMGTVDYMAPEQWENATNVDIRADIYSLGCTLYFMLTGHAPFETQQYNSQRKKLLAHLEGEIPDVERFRTDCPEKLIEIFRKMVAKEPQDRFQTPEELLKAMSSFADHAALKEVVKAAEASDPEPVRFTQHELTPVFRNSDEDTMRGAHRKSFLPGDSQFGDLNDIPFSSARRNWQSGYNYSKSQFLKTSTYLSRSLKKLWTSGFRSLFFILVSVLICIFVFRRTENSTDISNDSADTSTTAVDSAAHSLGNTSGNTPGNTKHSKVASGDPALRHPSHPQGLLFSQNAENRIDYPSPSQTLSTAASGTTSPASPSEKPGETSGAQKSAPKIDLPANVQMPTGDEVLKDLITLPGLTGKWWFLESPWYLPFVRAQIPDQLLQRREEILQWCQEIAYHAKNNPWITIFAVPYMDPNVLVAQDFLWELTKSISPSLHEYQRHMILELRKTHDAQLPGKELQERLQTLLAEFEQALESVPEEKRMPSDYHTLALLQHRIAQKQNGDPTFAVKAKESYRIALHKYAEMASTGHSPANGDQPALEPLVIGQSVNGQPVERQSVNKRVASQLQLLCQFDALRLAFETDRDLVAFEKEANALLKHEEDMSKLFQIEFLTTYGDYSMLCGKSNDSLFERAAGILEKLEGGALDHPLSAYLHERYAWSLIDQCKFIESEQQFDKALRIRQNNLERKNPFSASYVFHDRHGIAIVRRYLGDSIGAKEQFAKLVHDIKETLQNTDPNDLTQRYYISDLKSRLSNSLERYGDCVLFGGAAASGTKLSRVSTSDMKLAAELYDESRTVTESRAVWYVMSSKAVIIKSLLGQIAEAKQILDELCSCEKINFASDQNRAEMTFQVAELVYRIREVECEKVNFIAKIKENEQKEQKEQKKEEEIENGIENENAKELKNIEQRIAERYVVLRRFLIEFESETSSGVKFRREPLEMQLFCAELLISAKLDAGNLISAREELNSLETLLAHFNGYEKMRPFLNRFYDLAIRCYAESESDETAEMRERAIQNQLKYVRQSRFWQAKKSVAPSEPEPVPTTEGTFFFYFNSDGGFAIFAPLDKNLPVERFSIPYTRQEIMNAANTWKKLELPKVLADRIQKERQEGRNPTISYSDAPCWYNSKNALLDDDWPFNVPIE